MICIIQWWWFNDDDDGDDDDKYDDDDNDDDDDVQVMCPHSAYLSSFLKIHYTLLRFLFAFTFNKKEGKITPKIFYAKFDKNYLHKIVLK